jgi:hypothetical protein
MDELLSSGSGAEYMAKSTHWQAKKTQKLPPHKKYFSELSTLEKMIFLC